MAKFAEGDRVRVDIHVSKKLLRQNSQLWSQIYKHEPERVFNFHPRKNKKDTTELYHPASWRYWEAIAPRKRWIY